MKFWGPINSPGGVDGNDPYVDGNAVTGEPGSIPTFAVFEQTMRELVNLVTKSGITPDAVIDGVQVAQAVQNGKIKYATDSGTADALVVTLDPVPVTLQAGMRFLVLKGANANATTTPTIAVNGQAAKTIKGRGGEALAVGALEGSAMLDLAYDGINFRAMHVISLSALFAATSIVGRMTVYLNAGSPHTFTVPAGVTAVFVRVLGGGGAGGASANGTAGSIAGNAGGGGGAGAYTEKKITGLTPGGTVTVTVGAGGTPASNAAGGNGGNSSFGAYCTANGGSGGPWGVNTLAAGGGGGTAAGGDLNVKGGDGGNSFTNDANVTASYILNVFVRGGMPAGGLGTVPFAGTGAAGNGYGAGGAGASGGSGLAGGAGAPGICIVQW